MPVVAVKPLQLSGRKRKGGFKGTANWELLPSAVPPAPDQDAQDPHMADDTQPPAAAIGRESLRNVEPVNYTEPRGCQMAVVSLCELFE